MADEVQGAEHGSAPNWADFLDRLPPELARRMAGEGQRTDHGSGPDWEAFLGSLVSEVGSDEDDDEEEDNDGRSIHDSEDSSEAGLPCVVVHELERRRAAKERGDPPGPPCEDAVRALRAHFESETFDPFEGGGFLALMKKLGAAPRSDDPFVKDPAKNVWFIGETGGDTHEYWRSAREDHDFEVRLLRYSEFVQEQETKGLGPLTGWAFPDHQSCEQEEFEQEDAGVEDSYEDAVEIEEDSVGISIIDDNDMTQEQLIAISSGIIMGFWHYANHEKCFHGMARGVSMAPSQVQRLASGQQKLGDMRLFSIEQSEDIIIEQCNELRDRYEEQGRPLGLDASTTTSQPAKKKKKGSGKKNRRRRRQKQKPGSAQKEHTNNHQRGHAAKIADHIKKLLDTLQEQMSPSASFARVLAAVADMLSSALRADLDVARALVNHDGSGDAVVGLRNRAIEAAKVAGADTSRPLWAANDWWQACYRLTELLGLAVLKLSSLQETLINGPDPTSADGLVAAGFFETSVAPAFMHSVASTLPTERLQSLIALSNAACAVPRDCSLTVLVKNKQNWAVLESACHLPSTPQASQPDEWSRNRMRIAAKAAAEAVSFLANLCGRGMTIDNSFEAVTPVTPGPLSAKMIERGVVPLLIRAAQSSDDTISEKGMKGLAQISRMKDCREILWHEKNHGIDMLGKMLASSNGKKVSETMLFIHHLLWDEEWRDPLMSVEPPIEITAARWAAYSMQCIQERAYRMKNKMERQVDDHIKDMIQGLRLDQDDADPEENGRRQLKRKEFHAKMENEGKWTDLEKDDFRGEPFNQTLRRSLLLLNTTIHLRDGPNRLLSSGALSLAAACMDCLDDDTHGAAATIVHNLINRSESEISVNVFPDPDHLIYSIIKRMGYYAESMEFTPVSATFLRLAMQLHQSPGWDHVFASVSDRDPECKIIIAMMLRRMGQVSVMPRRRHSVANAPRSTATSISAINANCSSLTGKLKYCIGCGKLEGKKNSFQTCKACRAVHYCGRACQRATWKVHKKECKVLSSKSKGTK